MLPIGVIVMDINRKTAKSYLNIEIGKRIKAQRMTLNLTQEKFSEILDITPNHLGDVERGSKSLSLEKLLVFCDIFDLTLDYLVRGKTTVHIQSDLDCKPEKHEIHNIYQLANSCSEQEQAVLLSIMQSLVYHFKH